MGTVVFLSWPLFVGQGLYRLQQDRFNFKLNYYGFLINSITFLSAYTMRLVFPLEEWLTSSGINVLFDIYIFAAALHYMMFPSLILNSIEKNRKVKVTECIGDFFLTVFLPVGIWFLQPRINAVAMNNLGKDSNILHI